MKKSLIALLALIVVLMFAFTGCKKDSSSDNKPATDTPSDGGGADNDSDGQTNNGQNGSQPLPSDGLSVREGVAFNMLFEEESDVDWSLIDAIANITGKYPSVKIGEYETRGNEILFGRVDRKVTEDGYKLLERLSIENSKCQPYVVYSDGKSIAFCYDGYVLDDNLYHRYCRLAPSCPGSYKVYGSNLHSRGL